MSIRTCDGHRKELLKFLLLKTAAVRGGVKPGELLRVLHCYKNRNTGDFQSCLYRKDIFEIMRLDYIELTSEKKSSLVLFFNPGLMMKNLKKQENIEILRQSGYPDTADVPKLLEHLKNRFRETAFPHEVGVFVGYPAKDVTGFINKLPRTPVYRGDWAVFGDAGESISLMRLYRNAEKTANAIFEAAEDLQTFFDRFAEPGISGALNRI